METILTQMTRNGNVIQMKKNEEIEIDNLGAFKLYFCGAIANKGLAPSKYRFLRVLKILFFSIREI